MSRIGTCLQCGQRYGDIPDSLTATHVKCKSCDGVVEIPPIAAATPSAPVAPPAPAIQAPAAPSKPVVPPRPVAKAPVVPPRPAPAPVRPVSARPAPPPATPKPTAAAILAAARAKREAAAADSAPAQKLSAVEILAAAKAKRVQAAAPVRHSIPSKPAPVQRTSSTARRARHKQEEEGEGYAHHYAKPSNKGPMILVVVLVLVSAGAGGFLWMVQQNTKQRDAANQVNAGGGAASAQAGQPAAGVPDPVMSGDEGAPPAQPANAQPGSVPGTPAASDPAGAADAPPPSQPVSPPTADANFEFLIPEAGQPIETVKGLVDPARIRLDLVPPLAKWHGTDDATWKEVQDDLALYLDNSGARSNRAGGTLIEAGRHAFPAIVSAMMKQDYTTLEGVKMAGYLNDLLGKIGKGTHFGWRSAELHPIGSAEWTDSVLMQKKVTITWQRQWVIQFSINDAQWEAFSKKTTAKKEAAADGVPPPPQPF